MCCNSASGHKMAGCKGHPTSSVKPPFCSDNHRYLWRAVSRLGGPIYGSTRAVSFLWHPSMRHICVPPKNLTNWTKLNPIISVPPRVESFSFLLCVYTGTSLNNGVWELANKLKRKMFVFLLSKNKKSPTSSLLLCWGPWETLSSQEPWPTWL